MYQQENNGVLWTVGRVRMSNHCDRTFTEWGPPLPLILSTIAFDECTDWLSFNWCISLICMGDLIGYLIGVTTFVKQHIHYNQILLCNKLALQIEAYLYCVVLHRRMSYQFMSVPIGSYLFVVHSYRFVVHSHWNLPPVCCDSVQSHCRIGSHMFALVRVSSYWFLSCSHYIVAQSYWFSITTVLLHLASCRHCVASYCISLHRIDSCLIRVWFVLIRKQLSYHIVLVRHRGRTRTNPKFLSEKSPPFAGDIIRIDLYNYSPQWDGVLNQNGW